MQMYHAVARILATAGLGLMTQTHFALLLYFEALSASVQVCDADTDARRLTPEGPAGDDYHVCDDYSRTSCEGGDLSACMDATAPQHTLQVRAL